MRTSAQGTAYLKMDRRQWRLAVHPSEQPGLDYLGFEVRKGKYVGASMSGTIGGGGTTVELETVNGAIAVHGG